MASDGPAALTLHEAAERLGVHYMTVYRRVRLGVLPARKVDGTWWVDPADLDDEPTGAATARGRRRDGTPSRASTWRRPLAGPDAGRRSRR